MDVDQIRTYAYDRRRFSNFDAAHAADTVADLRAAYTLLASSWSSLSPIVDYDVYRKDIELTMARVVVHIRKIVDTADLPEEMRL
jgi:hypothetical protein